jgi:hypothetical protein
MGRWESIVRFLESIFQTHHVPHNLPGLLRMIEFGLLMRNTEVVMLEDFLLKAQTGDILVMTSDNIPSFIQTFSTWSTASHVALLYRDAEGPAGLWIYESTPREDGFIDRVTGKTKSGPMCVPAEKRIRHYLDEVGFSIRWRSNTAGGMRHNRTIERIMQRYKDYKFDADPISLTEGVSESAVWLLRLLGIGGKKPGTAFCSELVSVCLMEMQCLSRNRPACHYSPSDYTEAGHNVTLLPGCGLSTEKRILVWK